MTGRRGRSPLHRAAAAAVLLAALSGCQAAHADVTDAGVLLDELALPPGTVVAPPDAGAFRLRDTRFLLARTVVEECVEDGERVPLLEAEVAATAAALDRERAGNRTTTWIVAAKWSSIALLVSAAFTAGVLVAR